MRQYRYPIRVNTPQLLKYRFKDMDGTAIDLSDFLDVKLHFKKDGVAFDEDDNILDAAFDVAAEGRVLYQDFQFDSAGEWTIQFVATNSSDKPVHGEPARIKVVKNTADLDEGELPEY